MSQVNVNTIRNRTGGAPNLDKGIVVGAAATFSSSVSVGGTLTYEDVTNIDSVGIITARAGIKVTAGGINAVGVVTATAASVGGIVTADGVTVTTTKPITLGTGTTIHQSAANQLSLGTNSKERLRVTTGGGLKFISADSPASTAEPAQLLNHAGGFQLYGSSDSGTNRNIIICNASNSASEALRINTSGQVLVGTTTEGHASADDLTVANETGAAGITIRSGTSSQGSIYFSDAVTGAGEYASWVRYDHSGINLTIGVNEAERLKIDGAGNVSITGVTTASALVGRHGNVTSVTKSSGYVLVDGDQGKMIITDSDVTVPENIFGAGDVFTVCNSSGSSISVIKGSGINLYTVGSSTNATVTLAQKGIAIITCFSGNDFIVGGGGVS